MLGNLLSWLHGTGKIGSDVHQVAAEAVKKFEDEWAALKEKVAHIENRLKLLEDDTAEAFDKVKSTLEDHATAINGPPDDVGAAPAAPPAPPHSPAPPPGVTPEDAGALGG